jgi:hypothetical protein
VPRWRSDTARGVVNIPELSVETRLMPVGTTYYQKVAVIERCLRS